MEEEKLYSGADKTIIKKLLHFVKPYIFRIGIIFVFLLIISTIEIFLPIITKTVVDKYIERKYYKIKSDEISIKIADKYKSYAFVNDSFVFLPSRILPKHIVLELKSHSLICEEKYILIENKNKDILNKYDFPLIQMKNGFLLQYDYLKEIDKEHIKILRINDLTNVKKYALFYVLLLLISFLFTYLQVVYMAIVSENIMYDVRSAVVNKLLHLSMNYFRKNPIGRLVTRATNDIDALRELLTDVIIYSAKDIIVIIGVFIIMFRLSTLLAFVMLLIMPFVILLLFLFQKYARKAYRKVRLTLAKVNAFLSESISGMSIIQAFNQQNKIMNDFRYVSKKFYKANMYQLFIFSIFRPLIDVMSYITLGFLLYFGGIAVLNKTVSVGVLIAFISYVHMLFRPIFDFSEKFNIFQSAMASSERIVMILEEDDYIKETKNPIYPKKAEGKVEFRNVVFEYKKGERVLDNVSFTINPNESVAFVGATGAGKSTIINLLLRFYDIEQGEILIDNINIKQMELKYLRSYFGLVLQDVFMFAGDIKYNIALNRNIDDNKVIEYSKYVNAHTFIAKLENQYRNTISESGKNLSTGQRQLIAFARALAMEPKILILDEATSSIDSQTESLIQDAIKKIMKEKTSIAIAHRLSTIQDADRIYVLHKGKIIEQGTHKELLAIKGKYFELYKHQYIN